MAEVTSTYTTNAQIGQREDLSDIITRIDPDVTPFYSRVKKGTKKAKLFDWQTQDLKDAGFNTQNEGADTTAYSQTPTTLLQNVMQISDKAIKVSETANAIDTAGRAKESAYQSMLKGKEIKRDVEYSLMYDQVKSTSDPRATGTLSSFINNFSLGASATTTTFAADGSNHPVTNVTEDTTPADGVADDWGTVRAISPDLINDAMEMAFNDGGEPGVLFLSPKQKRKFSEATIASTSVIDNEMSQTATKPANAVGSVSIYLTDFGQVETVIDRFMPDERGYLIDMSKVEFVTLPGRHMSKTPLAKTGDSERELLTCEWGLVVHSPDAHAAVYALDPA